MSVSELDFDLPNTIQTTNEKAFKLDEPTDFPTGIEVDSVRGLIFIISKFGNLHVFCLKSAEHILSMKIDTETILVHSMGPNGELYVCNRIGQLRKVSIVEEANTKNQENQPNKGKMEDNS